MSKNSRRRIGKLALIALALGALAFGAVQASIADGPRSRDHSAQAPRTSGRPLVATSPGKATEMLGLDLMRRLGKGNLVFSPDSIAAALAMTGTGAAGETATQIARTLHLSSAARFASLGALQQTIAAEQASLARGSSEAPTLNIANGLFVKRGYPLLAPFTAALQQAFAAAPQAVDFGTANGAEVINAWISQQTHGLIPHLVGSLSPETRLALANAIYLKAAWDARFAAGGSRTGTFHGEAGARPATFMHETHSLEYARGRGYAALSLPYADSTLSMLVVLPVGQSLRKLERGLSASSLDGIVRRLSTREVRVSLPRFHLRMQTSLNAPLVALGMPDAFDEAKANFSGMTSVERLMIDKVIHGADLKVDEQGTEAAAATVVTLEPVMATRGPLPAVFVADHPFIFFLRDDRSGAVLFAGRLVTPQD